MMKRILLPLLATLAMTSTAHAALNEGDKAPAFDAQASLAGKAFQYSLSDALKKGAVVVYFYPSAFTGGCNLQAHTFAVNQEKFTAAGASIIGVSLDSIKRLNDFSADPQYCGGKIPVASDPDGKIAKSYALNIKHDAGHKDSRGVEIDHDFAERTTFIVTPDGKVSSVIGGVAPEANVAAALEKVQQLAKK
jgi:peroxiredoxin